jgi:hypothetical protein
MLMTLIQIALVVIFGILAIVAVLGLLMFVGAVFGAFYETFWKKAD